MPTITGVARDSAGDPVAGASVTAFRTSNDFPQGTSVADGSGNYSITVPGQDDHYVIAYLAGTPDIMGVTQNDLAPAGTAFDADAVTFLRRVMAADQQQLEPAVMTAINAFFVGLKADSLWDNILTGCLMVGARTLRGALTDIKGDAPLYGENFIEADYDRVTGLLGDGTSKSINTTIAHSMLAQNDNHVAVWATELDTTNSGRWMLGGTLAVNNTFLARNSSSANLRTRNSAGTDYVMTDGYAVGFMGMSRSGSTEYTVRGNGTTETASVSSTGQNNFTFRVFSTFAPSNYTASRLAWYSLGSAVDLEDLEARLATLLSDIGAALA